MEDAGVLPQLLDGLAQAAEAEERRRWAQRCADALELEGIAASLNSELVWFSNDTSARLEDAQFTLGQGPGLAPDFDQVPYQVADLGQAADERWPQFAAEARKLGVRAVFVWPLRAGAARFGTLTGYRSRPGPLTGRQAHDGLRVADVLAGRLLAWWPGAEATHGGRGPQVRWRCTASRSIRPPASSVTGWASRSTRHWCGCAPRRTPPTGPSPTSPTTSCASCHRDARPRPATGLLTVRGDTA